MGHIVVWLRHLDVDSEKGDTCGLWRRDLRVSRVVGVGLGETSGFGLDCPIPSFAPLAPCDADSHVFLHHSLKMRGRPCVHLCLKILPLSRTRTSSSSSHPNLVCLSHNLPLSTPSIFPSCNTKSCCRCGSCPGPQLCPRPCFCGPCGPAFVGLDPCGPVSLGRSGSSS